jgi:glycosyltransferase involved in cell wall biosynthesis
MMTTIYKAARRADGRREVINSSAHARVESTGASLQREDIATLPWHSLTSEHLARRIPDSDAPLRIALVGPVATSIPPPRSSSVELLTALLCDGLLARGHQVTLFATGTSRTQASLHATFRHGYGDDPTMWPWEICELFNCAAAIERSDAFDIIHYQAMYAPFSLAFSRLTEAPVVQTIHHAPGKSEVALWSTYPEAAFITVSDWQASLLRGLNVVATVHNGVDMSTYSFRRQPDDYLVWLGRFIEGKGVLQAIEVARRTGMRLLLAAADNDYYRTTIAPKVDGRQIIYIGEVDHGGKVALLGGARAFLFPVQKGEPFPLSIVEAMACGTPVAALGLGAVNEAVDDGITGGVFSSLDAMVNGLPRVLALDRGRVRKRARERFDVDRMVDGYLDVYRGLAKTAGARKLRL